MTEARVPLPAARELALLSLLLLSLLWLSQLNLPFSRVTGFADYIGNENGRIAANYLRYGLVATKGDQIRNLEHADEADWVHYNNHPASLDLMTAVVLWLSGSQEPWALRLLPLLAALASFWVFFQLVKSEGHDPWPALALWLAFPLTLTHGINLSYEPFCLLVLLLIVWLYRTGWRFGLLPLLFVGGLIDYPVLYIAPFLAVLEFVDARQGKAILAARKLRILFALGLFAVCILSLGTHLAHILWVMGGLEATQGQSWLRHIQHAVFSRAASPGLFDFVKQQAIYLSQSFTLPGLLALLAALFHHRQSRSGLAFLYVGLVHLLVFRAHAMAHDFWLVYFTPFVAIEGARVLRAIPKNLGSILLVLVAVLGFHGSLAVWAERAESKPREVAKDLSDLFTDDVVLHSLFGPAGWALESWRGHPVMDAGDLLNHPYAVYLDRIGSMNYLYRKQLLFVPAKAFEDKPNWREILEEKIFPSALLGSRHGAEGEYLVYDIGRFLIDPRESPFLMNPGLVDPERTEQLSAEDALRLRDRSRKFLVLTLFPAGRTIVYLDGRRTQLERFRKRYIRSGTISELDTGLVGLDFVAWPGSDEAKELERRGGSTVLRLRYFAGDIEILHLPAKGP